MPSGKDAAAIWTPPKEIVEKAIVKDYDALRREAAKNPLKFWEERAKELSWYQPWTKVLDDSKAPFYQWFVGGKTNICLNALDRWLGTPMQNKLALIWEGENGSLKTYSYFALAREVCQFANVLKSMGVKKGDRVTIYLPRILELPIAMLACAKIGAVHSVVYGGFSVESLHERIEDSESRVVVTADGGYMRGKIVPLKAIVDEALQRCGMVEHVIVVRRTGEPVNMEPERDYYYDDLLGLPIAKTVNGDRCSTEVMDAEDPLFLLYTSGTTGKPKAIVHTHGGYQVDISATMQYCFDVRPEDRWWCAADPGWITGHSYIVYAPLILGATSIIYEGAPTYPYPDRWWRIVEKYGVSILYTAPTAIRGLMRFGESWVNRHDLSTLRLLGSVGEPINPEAWRWYHRVVGKERCPVIDTWWQTETGGFMIAPGAVVPAQARVGHQAVPRHTGRSGGRRRQAGSARRGRQARHHDAVARDAARHLQGPGAVRPAVLVHVSRQVPDGRLGEDRRGRLLLDHRPRGRRHQGVRLPAGDGGDRVGAGQPPRGVRGGCDRPPRRGQGKRHSRLRDAPGRVRALARAVRGADPARRPRDRAHRPPGEGRFRGRAAQDPLGQDHAARPQGACARAARGRRVDAGELELEDTSDQGLP